jgi:hypothetical protein
MEKEYLMAGDMHLYRDKCSYYQSAIDTIIGWEKKSTAEMPEDPFESAVRAIAVVNGTLDLSSYYIMLNELSHSILGKKDDIAINNARKTVIKAITLMEELVSPYLDAPYGDYQDRVERLERVSAQERYFLVRKQGFAIDLLKNTYGENTKWKWSFVDLEGRFITVTKNFLDLKKAVYNTDLRSPDYEPTFYHVRLIKKLLAKGASMYREKYEIVSHIEADFKKGIDFLNALRYIYSMLGEANDAELTKKKIGVWTEKLETDVKRAKLMQSA